MFFVFFFFSLEELLKYNELHKIWSVLPLRTLAWHRRHNQGSFFTPLFNLVGWFVHTQNIEIKITGKLSLCLRQDQTSCGTADHLHHPHPCPDQTSWSSEVPLWAFMGNSCSADKPAKCLFFIPTAHEVPLPLNRLTRGSDWHFAATTLSLFC